MLEIVHDTYRISDAVARMKVVVDQPGDLQADWYSAEGRIAVPEESGLHLDADQCERLSVAMTGAGTQRLVAVATEPLRNTPLVYELDTSPLDLAEFSTECAGLNYALLPEQGTDFVVICSVDDYVLIAGPRSLVLDYVGSIEAARNAYDEFVANHFDAARAPLERIRSYFEAIA